MDPIYLIIALACLGLMVWLIPMDERFKQLIYVVAVIIVVLFVISVLLSFRGGHPIRIGQSYGYKSAAQMANLGTEV